MVKSVVIIPARLDSVRLPQKMLRDIAGQSLIQRTHAQAVAAGVGDSWVAVDGERLKRHVESFGGRPIVTEPALTSGTERCAAAAALLGLADDDWVIDLQGDEPIMPAANLCALQSHFEDTQAEILTLAEPFGMPPDEGFRNENLIKVVTDRAGMALYFSRAPIPWPRGGDAAWAAAKEFRPLKHIGVYAMTVRRLREFTQLPPSPLEVIESLEQLRAMQAGWKIGVVMAPEPAGISVDTEEDLNLVRSMLQP